MVTSRMDDPVGSVPFTKILSMPNHPAHASRVASTLEIRNRFPALERRHGGMPVAYFDGPGGTQVPRGVVEAVTDYLLHHNANTHWGYPTSQETDALLAGARQALADFLNARPDEIAFGANMTTLTFHVARALGRGLGPGDEIVVTELDHHANVAPWQALARERGVTIRVAKMQPDAGQIDRDDLARQFNERTKILAIGAASNALGTVNDVRDAVRLAHDVGALVFVDAVHYAAHLSVDVRAWDCDFLACSAYKFYGPHIGVLYGKHDRLQALDVPKLLPAPDTAPERCETGTQNHEGIAGAAAAVDFLASLTEGPTRRERLQTVLETLHERGAELVAELWEGLAAIDGVRLYGPPPNAPRTSTVSFTVGARPSADVSRHLADRGLFASHGNFYAATAVERLGRSEQGLVRIGCACYTTNDEMARLIQEVHTLARSS
jgi:cysteine desulfurase family protein (TIGR01976 family)